MPETITGSSFLAMYIIPYVSSSIAIAFISMSEIMLVILFQVFILLLDTEHLLGSSVVVDSVEQDTSNQNLVQGGYGPVREVPNTRQWQAWRWKTG